MPKTQKEKKIESRVEMVDSKQRLSKMPIDITASR